MQPDRDVVDRQSALDFLFGRINYERTANVPYRSNEFKLDRMRRLLAGLGDPHLALKAVHIAGTKGKGSTAAMVTSILSAAGYSVGLYTSPHLVNLEERMVVGGRQCDEETFVRLVAEAQRVAADMDRAEIAHERRPGPTFFEITTAMAMLHFVRQNVDLAVLEVGLGGRLDSTNVCQPVACGITSISFDHTKQLGNTLAAIAGEKAGIIKSRIPVVSGVTEAEPREAIEAVAAEVKAPLRQRGVHFDSSPLPANVAATVAGERLAYWDTFSSPRYEIVDLQVGMLGSHQVHNAGVAVALVRTVAEQGWDIPESAIRRGLLAANSPARVEMIGQRPVQIVDVAHNLASVEALVRVLDERFAKKRRVLVFATSRDKDTAGMLRLLLPRFDRVVLTRFLNNPRAVEPEELLQMARTMQVEVRDQGSQSALIETQPTPLEAWQRAQKLAGEDDLICVTGSFFLAAELRPAMVETPVAPVGV